MTRKDYIVFANSFKRLRSTKLYELEVHYRMGVEDCLDDALRIFARDNPHFNQEVFEIACQPDPVEAFTKSLNV